MTESFNHEPSAPNALIVSGAFETFEGALEELDTLTRYGRLLQPGDSLPPVPELNELARKPYLLHAVNALGTETCDECVDELKAFQRDHPDVTIVTLTKQTDDQQKESYLLAGKPEDTHQGLMISHESAIDLGIALAPGNEAAEAADFWPGALRRTLALIDAKGRVVAIDQPDDQEVKPSFEDIYEKLGLGVSGSYDHGAEDESDGEDPYDRDTEE